MEVIKWDMLSFIEKKMEKSILEHGKKRETIAKLCTYIYCEGLKFIRTFGVAYRVTVNISRNFFSFFPCTC